MDAASALASRQVLHSKLKTGQFPEAGEIAQKLRGIMEAEAAAAA